MVSIFQRSNVGTRPDGRGSLPPASAAAAPNLCAVDDEYREAVARVVSHDEYPSRFLCPITHCLMRNAVIDEAGRTYDEAAIRAYLAQGNVLDPIDRSKPVGRLIPNYSVRGDIEAFKDAVRRHDPGFVFDDVEPAASASTTKVTPSSKTGAPAAPPRPAHVASGGRPIGELPVTRSAPGARPAVRSRWTPTLPGWVAPLVATAVGCGTFAGLTYWIDRSVKHWVATAQVDNKPGDWLQAARAKYEACYEGCDDCDDTDWAYNACQLTTQLGDAFCDAANIWFWAGDDRYPSTCLTTLGANLKAEALAAEKHRQLAKYSLIILAAVAGAASFAASFYLVRAAAQRLQRRAAAQRAGGAA